MRRYLCLPERFEIIFLKSYSRASYRTWVAVSLGIAILIAWLVYAAIFVCRIDRGEGEALAPQVRRLIKEEPREEWFAICQHGHRAGYSHTKLVPQRQGYALIEELFFRVDFLDETQDVSSTVQAELAPDFSLRSFTFRLQAGTIAFRLRGEVQDSNMIVVSRMAGEEQTRQIELSNPIYLASSIKFFLANERLRVGDSFKLAMFDPASLCQTLIPLRVEARETILVHGQHRESLRVVIDFHGAKLRSWISPYGEVLKEEGFLGMTLIKTDADDALDVLSQGAAVEMVREAAVVPDRTIARPRDLKRLRVQLAGITGSNLDIAGGRQQWHKGELTIVREAVEKLPHVRIPCNDPEMAQHLRPGLLIQSDAPELKRQAAAIVGKETDALRAATQISAWVYENIDKRPTLSIPSALDILTRRTGDCNEHSAIFAALARAAGIPTRMVAGVLYMDGRFFYHAWNEVNVGEWVAMDALLNQVPADATHIRLVTGGLERQVELLGVIGRLRIRVLAYE